MELMYNKNKLLYIVQNQNRGHYMNQMDSQTTLTQLLHNHKEAFSQAPFPTYQQRITHLRSLKALMLDNQAELISAMVMTLVIVRLMIQNWVIF